MGVYIDMEMPKDKAVAVVIHPDGTAYTAEMVAGVCTEYLADCTAVPVPPHRRLIDADEIKTAFPCGERLQLSYWADRLSINYHTLYDRLYLHGWSVEKAFTTPVRRSV